MTVNCTKPPRLFTPSALHGAICTKADEDGVPNGEMALRMEPSKNCQSSRVNLASDYELPG
jgi:hypothetical protein